VDPLEAFIPALELTFELVLEFMRESLFESGLPESLFESFRSLLL
jgi:hypothetical protein